MKQLPNPEKRPPNAMKRLLNADKLREGIMQYFELSKRDLRGILCLLALVLILLFVPSILNILLNGGSARLDYSDLRELSLDGSRQPQFIKQHILFKQNAPKDGSEKRSPARVHLNQATEEELETLPGLTNGSAYKILSYRKRNGDFTDLSELKNTGLIDEKTYDQISGLLSL